MKIKVISKGVTLKEVAESASACRLRCGRTTSSELSPDQRAKGGEAGRSKTAGTAQKHISGGKVTPRK